MPRVEFTGEQATMLATLYGRAVDAESPGSILHDTMALSAVRKLDVDFTKVGLRRGDAVAVALRVRQLDRYAGEFLATHPECTVLHLGCGLDTRFFRLDPGPGVRWFDVDYPEVIALRPELFPGRDGYELIGSSVTDPAWLARVPGDRPVLVVAEGLTMYLEPADGAALFRRIVDHFPAGQLAFDAFSGIGIRLGWFNPVVRAAHAKLSWGIDSGAELEAIDPRLRCVSALSAFDMEDFETQMRAGGHGIAVAVGKRIPAMRRMSVFYRLDF
jgi:O-methyltransferase involved in polyketide biosynthesis